MELQKALKMLRENEVEYKEYCRKCREEKEEFIKRFGYDPIKELL